MSLRVLRAGIDTLEVSFSGELAEGYAERLDSLKTAAFVRPQPFMAGIVEMMVQAKAFGFWRWRLVSPEFSIVLKKGSGPGGVSAQVRMSAWGLANRDLEDLWVLVRLTMSCLGSFLPLSLSRVDACVDFQGWTPSPGEMANVVCSASYRATHGTAKEVQTYQFGKGDHVFRLYDKTAEVEVSGKGWLPDLWRQSQLYDPSEPVHRAEIQLRRSALAAIGCDCVEQVIADPGALLDYGLRWAQMRVPSADATSTRWPEDPRWARLRHAVFGGVPLGRVPKASELMSLDRAKSSLVGLAATAGAYFGVSDYLKALQMLSMAAEVHMMHEGIDFAVLVEDKRRRILSGEH